MLTTCRARSDDGLTCTEQPGHEGAHVAEGPDGEVLAMWMSETGR